MVGSEGLERSDRNVVGGAFKAAFSELGVGF